MVAIMILFHLTIQKKIKALYLSPTIKGIISKKLIPAFYLNYASNKAKISDARHRIQKKSEKIFSSLGCMQDPFSGITQKGLTVIQTVTKECASLF